MAKVDLIVRPVSSGTLSQGPSWYYLASSDIWALEVSVEQEVEVERDVLVWIVDADIHVEFLFAQDEPVEKGLWVSQRGEGLAKDSS